ncbi:MAG: hypothetical protein AAGF83_22690 [Cyanobacteria bacterium P01_G01_bin.67]
MGGRLRTLLLGEQGHDTLIGGAEFDILTGSREVDVFVLELVNGKNLITDFKLERDRLGVGGDLS